MTEDQAHPNLDGDQSHREGREELENTTREKRHAQRRHRRLRIRLAQRAQVGARSPLASERAERGQSRDEIQELGGQTLHRRQFLVGGRLGEATDQDHEKGNQRNHEQRDDGRPKVEQQDDPQRRGSDGAHEDQLGEEGHEVGAQVFEAAGGQSRRLCTIGRPPPRPQRNSRLDDAAA